MKPLHAILAVAEDGTVGIDGKIPWSIPEDMKHFRRLTKNHSVIMGRKTFESIGKALPDRTNIIMTLDERYRMWELPDRAWRAAAEEPALELAYSFDPEPFVIGGAEIYRLFWPLVTTVHLTRVYRTFPIVPNETNRVTFEPDLSAFKVQFGMVLARTESGYVDALYERWERA